MQDLQIGDARAEAGDVGKQDLADLKEAAVQMSEARGRRSHSFIGMEQETSVLWFCGKGLGFRV